MTAPTSTQIPGYVVGTWDIDPVHSDVSFTVRHMMQCGNDTLCAGLFYVGKRYRIVRPKPSPGL